MDKRKRIFIEKLKKFGKVEALDVNDSCIDVKVTNGFDLQYENAQKLLNLIEKSYPEYKNIQALTMEVDLFHITLSKDSINLADLAEAINPADIWNADKPRTKNN